MKRVGSASSSLCSAAGAPVSRVLSNPCMRAALVQHGSCCGIGSSQANSATSSPTSFGCPRYPHSLVNSPTTAPSLHSADNSPLRGHHPDAAAPQPHNGIVLFSSPADSWAQVVRAGSEQRRHHSSSPHNPPLSSLRQQPLSTAEAEGAIPDSGPYAEDDDLAALGECPEEVDDPVREAVTQEEIGNLITTDHHHPHTVLMKSRHTETIVEDSEEADIPSDATQVHPKTRAPAYELPTSRSPNTTLDSVTIRAMTTTAFVDDGGSVPTDLDEEYFNPFTFRAQLVGLRMEFFTLMGFGLKPGSRNARMVYVRDRAQLVAFAEKFRQQYPNTALGIPRSQQYWERKAKGRKGASGRKDEVPREERLPYAKPLERNLYKAFHPDVVNVASVVQRFLDHTYAYRSQNSQTLGGSESDFYKTKNPKIDDVIMEMELSMQQEVGPAQVSPFNGIFGATSTVTSADTTETTGAGSGDASSRGRYTVHRDALPTLEKQGRDMVSGFFMEQLHRSPAAPSSIPMAKSPTIPFNATNHPTSHSTSAKEFLHKYQHLLSLDQRRRLQYTLFKEEYEEEAKKTAATVSASRTGDHVELTQHQVDAIELATRGFNLFIGGSAGTGKSVLLRVLKRVLTRKLGLRVCMAGTTGMAATNVNGSTIYRALQIDPLTYGHRDANLLTAYDVIIIDEASFLTADFLQALDEKLRLAAGGSPMPFGGIQIILCGDFLQLGFTGPNSSQVLMSEIFCENFVMMKLSEVVRQSDPTFVGLLRQIRRGEMPESLVKEIGIHIHETHSKGVDGAALLRPCPQTTYSRLAETGQLEAAQLELDHIKCGLHADDSGLAAPVSEMLDRRRNFVLWKKGRDWAEGSPIQPQDTTHVVTTKHHGSFLMKASGSVSYVPGAVNLLPTNFQARVANKEELDQLPGEVITYTSFVGLPVLLQPHLWTDVHLLRPIKKDSGAPQWRSTSGVQETILTMVKRRVPQVRINQVKCYWLNDDTLAIRVQTPTNYEGDLDECRDELNAVMLRIPTMVAVGAAEPSSTHPDSEVANLNQVFLASSQNQNLLEGVDMSAFRDFTYAGSLPSTGQTFTSADFDNLNAALEKEYFAKPTILKVGAKVMIRKNISHTIVNGTIGTVVGFEPSSAASKSSKIVSEFAQFAEMEMGVRDVPLPIVQFANGTTKTILPSVSFVGGRDDTNDHGLRVIGVPLTLAYAFTVHKVQGLTLLGRVHISLFGLWNCPHYLYVALSRVKDIKQLSLSGFTPSLVSVQETALLFDDSLPAPSDVFIPPLATVATWKRFPSQRRAALAENRRKVLLKRQKEIKIQSLLSIELPTLPEPNPGARSKESPGRGSTPKLCPPCDTTSVTRAHMPISAALEGALMDAARGGFASDKPTEATLPYPTDGREYFFSSSLGCWMVKKSRAEMQLEREARERAIAQAEKEEDNELLARSMTPKLSEALREDALVAEQLEMEAREAAASSGLRGHIGGVSATVEAPQPEPSPLTHH